MALIEQGIPMIMARGFNCVLGPEDKRSSRPFVEDIGSREFGNFLQSNGLVDLGFAGPRNTWYNNRSGVARV